MTFFSVTLVYIINFELSTYMGQSERRGKHANHGKGTTQDGGPSQTDWIN